MPRHMRVRRFGGRPYRLFQRVPHFDSRGRNRSPQQTALVAEAWAESYRNRGYNARVVNWVGGSGIFLAPRIIRTYAKTKEEARQEWMEQIEESDYGTAAFGIGQAFSTTASAGDPIQSAKHAFRNDAGIVEKGQAWLPSALGTEYIHPQSLSTLDDALQETELIPVHVASPRGTPEGNNPFLTDYYANSIMSEIINEPGWFGQIGWGSGEIPDERMPSPSQYDLDRRTRYRVVLQFEQKDGYGERPSFAFGTRAAAEKFTEKLRWLINHNGYYAEGGKIEPFPGAEFNSPKWIIPAEEIDLEIVEEVSGFAQKAQDDARAVALDPDQLFPFGRRPEWMPPKTELSQDYDSGDDPLLEMANSLEADAQRWEERQEGSPQELDEDDDND